MSKNSSDVVITSAVRTPIGAYKGSLKDISADKLGSLVIKEAIYKSKLNVNEIDEVIMGHVLTSGLGQNPARQASINAGIPVTKPAHIVNQVCGSGLRSVVSGYQTIKLLENEIVVSGGQENMSRTPHSIFYRENKHLEENQLIDTMLKDGLIDSFKHYHMGVTAENIAEKFNITREDQDSFSLNSQTKTELAYISNKFKDEIVKLKINNNKREFIFDKDEHPRSDISFEDLKKLKSVFKKYGTVTAGNSSGINDGASALVMMRRDKAELKSIEPLVKIVSWSSCGVEPSFMGLGPIPSIKKALNKAQWILDDIDLFEINEAFASQCIAVIKELKIPEEKVNVNGGAIALGHPIGASGARILTTLIHELRRQNKKKGCAALCIGGGMGIAMCIERN
tara:strand:- start:695 stop:1882 length:1188 start_codon:yes stop_codon:yes gene_type:complete